MTASFDPGKQSALLAASPGMSGLAMPDTIEPQTRRAPSQPPPAGTHRGPRTTGGPDGGQIPPAKKRDVAGPGAEVSAVAPRRPMNAQEWDLAVHRSLSLLFPTLLDPASTVPEMAGKVLAEAKRLTDSPLGFVSEIDPATGHNVVHTLFGQDGEWAKHWSADGPVTFAPDADGSFRGLFGYALNTREPFYTNQPSEHPACVGVPPGHARIRRFLSVPAVFGKKVVGQISLANSEREYSDRDLRAMGRFAGFYALAIQRSRSDQALAESERRERRRAESLAQINEVVASLVAETDGEQICHSVTAAVHRLIPAAIVLASYMTADGAHLKVTDAYGVEKHLSAVRKLLGVDPLKMEYPIAEMTAEDAAQYRSGRLVKIEDGLYAVALRQVPRRVARAIEKLVGVESVYAIGLAWDGRHFGGLTLATRRGCTVTEHVETIETLVHQASIALQRSRSERELAAREADLSAAAERLRRSLDGTVRAMGQLVETRDPYTAGHERRVTTLAVAIASRLGLDARAITALRLAAGVHDIGKIAVPAEILSKPGRLTDVEYVLIKQHPQVGRDILRTVEFDWPLADIVYQHHERLDGSGYPEGLTGDEIGIEARVLAVADVVEAMASHRPYRPSLGLDAALAEIRDGRGRLYDAAAVDACLAVLDEGFDFGD